MNDCRELVSGFSALSRRGISKRLLEDEPEFFYTRALLDLVYNLIQVRSVQPEATKGQLLKRYTSELWTLVSPTVSIAEKNHLLASTPSLVALLARVAVDLVPAHE